MRYTVSLTIDASGWHSSVNESDAGGVLFDALTSVGASMHFLPHFYRFNIAVDADDPATALSMARSNLSIVAGKAGLPDYPILSVSTRAEEAAASAREDNEVGELLAAAVPSRVGEGPRPPGPRQWRLHRLGRVRSPRRS
jgi:hypothetical protein